MRIVLATSPAEGRGWASIMPPLGLAYLAGSVRNLPAVEVRTVDAMGEGLNAVEATERIISLAPDVVGLSVTSSSIQRGLRLITGIKRARPEILTIAGGYHATAFDHLILRETPELDMVLRGEVDRSFPALCRCLLSDVEIVGVPGLSYRVNGDVVSGLPQYIEDLDSVPFPDRTTLDFRGYWQTFDGWLLPELPRMATLISWRGCPHRCTFCSKLTPGSKMSRMRSVKNVFREVQQLSAEGYELIFFVDENFTHNVNRIRQLCRMIIDRDLGVRFLFQGTLHNLPQSVLDLMHQAGFDMAFVGVESGSDAQLKRYAKSGNSRAIAGGIKRAKKAHMVVHGYFMCGGPGETSLDWRATKEFVRKATPHLCGIAELMVFPGSPLWDDLVGPQLPENTVESSCNRPIHTIPGQTGKEVIEERIRDFNKSFIRSWLTWRRIPEVIDLLRFNGAIRSLVINSMRQPRKKRRALLANWIKGIFRSHRRVEGCE